MAAPETVSILIPAFNEGPVVFDVVRALRSQAGWYEVIVIDDGSSDQTGRLAAEAGATVVRHPYNKGNGAAIKSGIRAASGEFILIVDGDGQHQPGDATRIASRLGEYDLVVGARASHTQASLARRLGNGALNRFASYMTGRQIPDLTSGFRGARASGLREFLHLLPNGFSTPATTTLAFVKAGYNVAFEPIEALQRTGSSNIRLMRDGAKFFLIILRVVTIFSPLKVFVPVSGIAAVVGVAYGAWTVATDAKIPNGSVLLLMFAVVVFLVGLVSEQITTLRFGGRGVTAVPPRVLVVIPTYNERDNLEILVEQVLACGPAYAVFVVDDQSPDGTGAIADELAQRHPGRVEVMHRTGKRGLGRSYVDALSEAVTRDVDIVCQMDADFSHDPKYLPSLVDAIGEQNFDLVIGSRYLHGVSVVNWPLRRLILSTFANRYVRGVTGLPARDCTSGYRCWRRASLAKLPLRRFVSDGYAFLVEMLYEAMGAGCRIGEVPIIYVERREGQSKMSRSVIAESVLMPWRMVLRNPGARRRRA